jgi:hypothetical protein
VDELANRILEYMATTYGRKVWVVDWKNPPYGWRAFMFDFSQTDQSPFYMTNIPEYERRWFISAVMRDSEASYAEQKGNKWFWFLDPKNEPATNVESLGMEMI